MENLILMKEWFGMIWGFKNWLNIILFDGRVVMLVIDYGYFLGLIYGLE